MDNLILQIQQDNEHAFKQLYQAYYIRVVTFIMILPRIWHKMCLSIYGLTGRHWTPPEVYRTTSSFHHAMRPLTT